MLKNCLAIHDLCCFSKSSLTVVIPTLETLGVEVCPLPSALLSTQTDGFDSFYLKPLDESINKIIDIWENYDLSFNCIYTGFLSDSKQINLIDNIIKHYAKEDTLIVIDPVFADNKKIYPTIDLEHIKQLKNLISNASIITPNITEAAFLTGMVQKEKYSISEIQDMVMKLEKLGPKKIIITSLKLNNQNYLYNCCFEKGKLDLFPNEILDYSYPGTGDFFASLLIGFLLNDYSLYEACRISGEIATKAMILTKEHNIERKRGIYTPLSLPLINSYL